MTNIGRLIRKSEIWNIIDNEDNDRCPVYETCNYRLNGGWCPFFHRDKLTILTEAIDTKQNQVLDDIGPGECPGPLRLIRLLTEEILNFKGIYSPPIPSELAFELIDTCVTISSLPLKSLHGAVWCLKDEILIFTNKSESSAAKRTAIFHEIFHAMCFYYGGVNVGNNQGLRGTFMEMLAGYFSLCLLLPVQLVVNTWSATHDIETMANTFQVTPHIITLRLKRLGFV